jgi:hypothetical protein
MESKFDEEAHNNAINERYRQLARFDAFDKLVDMALDGVITLEQAQVAWESEEIEWSQNE